MVPTGIAHGLLDRHAERDLVDGLLAVVRDGRSSVLVVHGAPGIGKSALLDYAIDSASGFRVVRAEGVESEIELPFAALQQLCAPMLDRLERLPGPQRDALRVAFGLSAGHPPDRFLVALAVLSLLSEVAEERPLLVVVDDAQWLDQASARSLAFVARRLLAEPVALMFATRELGQDLTGLPDLVVGGLADGDARALLASATHARLDHGVEERILMEAGGNPLALLELPRGSTTSGLLGGLCFSVSVPLRIEEAFRRRLATLPADTRQLLAVAAAEPVGDPVLVWRAAEWLGIGTEAAEAAEAEGLLTFGARVAFRHPVVRSVVYVSASLPARRAAHRALAHVTDPRLDPDRRAWHRAQATPGPDEEIAAELERCAGRARARGGVSAAAAFLEKAATLTLEPARRAERALAAAKAKFEAGALDAVPELLSTAEAEPLQELQHAQIDLLRAQVAAASRGTDAPPLLLMAARRLEPVDPALARETYLEALAAAIFAGRLDSGGVLEAAKAARTAPPSPQPPRACDLLLDGLVLAFTAGDAAAAPVLRRALDTLLGEEFETDARLRWLWLAGAVAGRLWDLEAWDLFSARLVRLARDAGALTELILALGTRPMFHVFAGEFAIAASLVEEVGAIAGPCGHRISLYGAVSLAAFRGRETEASQVIETTSRDFQAAGEGMGLTVGQWATAVLYNGLARYEDAFVAAELASADHDNLRHSAWALAELVEAASRTGRSERGAEALRRLTEITRASGTDWALGIEARSRALLCDGEAAECLYREAIDRLARTRVRVELARSHLLYGEWLRRERRRLDARQQLRKAYELFLQFGAEAFAERARVELNATGERTRKRSPDTRDELTPQEAQISRLAAEGATNQEIAEQLFISASTVDYHLRKAFRKLGVRSRTQLARHFLAHDTHPLRAA
jgi:DNA-binding CsgD family transcriptional regulator